MLLGFLSCREAALRLDLYLDRELSPRERQQVARHLKICRECARHFRFEAAITAGLKAKLGRLDAPPGLLESIRAALPDE